MPHSARPISGAYYHAMKNKPSSAPLPTTTTDADDTRIDIDRLETEAQTHDYYPDDNAKRDPVVSSGRAAQQGTAVFQLLLPGGTWGGSPCLMLGQRL
jgi:hypothetical protein